MGASIWSSSCALNAAVVPASCAKAPYGTIITTRTPIRARLRNTFLRIISLRLVV